MNKTYQYESPPASLELIGRLLWDVNLKLDILLSREPEPPAAKPPPEIGPWVIRKMSAPPEQSDTGYFCGWVINGTGKTPLYNTDPCSFNVWRFDKYNDVCKGVNQLAGEDETINFRYDILHQPKEKK